MRIEIEEQEAPEAIFWACRDGSIKTWTMDAIDSPCEGCDCGMADVSEMEESSA